MVASWLSIAGTVAARAWPAWSAGGTRSTFGGSFVVDNYILLFKGLFLGSLLLVLLMSQRYINAGTVYQGEFYFLVLSSFVGMLLMPSSLGPPHAVPVAGDRLGHRLHRRRLPQGRRPRQRGALKFCSSRSSPR